MSDPLAPLRSAIATHDETRCGRPVVVPGNVKPAHCERSRGHIGLCGPLGRRCTPLWITHLRTALSVADERDAENARLRGVVERLTTAIRRMEPDPPRVSPDELYLFCDTCGGSWNRGIPEAREHHTSTCPRLAMLDVADLLSSSEEPYVPSSPRPTPETTTRSYVLGFAFDHKEPSCVVLIYKQHGPADVLDRMNGVGGKIRAGETVTEAMRREFEEETGVATSEEDWSFALTFHGRDYEVHVLRAFGAWIHDVQTTTDEHVEVTKLRDLQDLDLAPHVAWLIPLLCDRKVAGTSRDVCVSFGSEGR